MNEPGCLERECHPPLSQVSALGSLGMNLGCNLPWESEGLALGTPVANHLDCLPSTHLGTGRHWARGELIILLNSDSSKAPGRRYLHRKHRNLLPECSRQGPHPEVIQLLPDETPRAPPWQPGDTLPRPYPEADSCASALFSQPRKLMKMQESEGDFILQIPLNIFYILVYIK